jgi:hypothetical protein
MPISSINNSTNPSSKTNFPHKRLLNFTGLSCSQIEQKMLHEDGIISDFKNNQLVADSVLATVNIFKNILGKEYLPSQIQYVSFREIYPEHTNTLGIFCPTNRIVAINSDFKCFNSFNNLKLSHLWDYNILLDNEKSTIHPLHTFVHEFAHCAHYTNLCKKNNSNNWDWLCEQDTKGLTFLADSCIYGKYSKTDLSEYFAEVMTKEILKNIPSSYPDQYIDTNKIRLKTIEPGCIADLTKLNTYNIWQGDKEKIENNISNMIKLNDQLFDVNLILRGSL